MNSDCKIAFSHILEIRDVPMVIVRMDKLSISKMLVLHTEFTSYDTLVLNTKYWECEMNILDKREAFFSVTVLKERGIQR